MRYTAVVFAGTKVKPGWWIFRRYQILQIYWLESGLVVCQGREEGVGTPRLLRKDSKREGTESMIRCYVLGASNASHLG